MQIDPDKLTIAAIVAHLEPAGKTILEIGCGDGRITCDLQAYAGSLVGVDVDSHRLHIARECSPAADFILTSGEDLSVAAQCFDGVLFTLSLHHQNSLAALREAARVVRKGGRIVVVEPVTEGELEQLCNLLEDESDELTRAMEAVETSGLPLEGSEVIYPRWCCAGIEEFSRWICTHYRQPYDPALREEFSRILGKKAGNRPLIVADTLRVITLRC